MILFQIALFQIALPDAKKLNYRLIILPAELEKSETAMLLCCKTISKWGLM